MTGDLRHRASRLVDPEMHEGHGLSRFNKVVMISVLLTVLIGILETEVRVIDSIGGLTTALKAALFLFFAVEYGLRLWVAPLNPRFRTGFQFALTPASLLDLAVLISFLMPFLGVEGTVFRLLRLTRLIRLARIGRYSRAMSLLIEAIKSRDIELVMSVGIALAVMIASATLLYIVESPVQPEAFGSIPRALWWAVATLTTVGYGDVVPITPLGRVLSAITALCGIGLIALPTGVLAGAFSDAIRRAREEGPRKPGDDV